MRFKKLRRKLLILFFSLSAFALLLVNAFLIWVVTGPRSLEIITPYIESALDATDGSYKVKIGSSVLSWDGWERPIGIHVKDVRVHSAQGAPIAAFPDVAIRLNIFSLMVGRLNVKSVEVDSPYLLLFQAEDGSLSLGFAEPQPQEAAVDNVPAMGSLPALLASFASGEGDRPIDRLKSIGIRHAKIAIKNARSGLFFYSDNGSLDIRRGKGRAEGSFTLPVQFENKAGVVQASLIINAADKSIKAAAMFDNMPSSLLRELFPAQEWMKIANMPLSGNVGVNADFEGHIGTAAFKAEAGPGVVDYPAQFDEKLVIRKIRLDGELSDRLTKFKLREGLLDFGEVTLAFDGYFRKEEGDYAVDAGIRASHIPIDSLRRYWPKSLSPHTRAWVIERISKGEVEKADVALHFKPGELALKVTPHDAVAATLDIKGADVLYMPNNPPVTDVAGQIAFTGDSMEANILSAAYLTGTKVTAGNIKFPDLNAADVLMYLDMDVTAPAEDVQTFLALPALDKAKKLGLTKEISGKASGNAKLNMIAFSEDETKNSQEVPDINYDLTATLEKVGQPKFLGKYDITDADMKVEVNNKGIKATGKAGINGLPMGVTAESQFNATHDTRYAITTTMPVERLPDFNLPKLDWIKGSMEVDGSFDSSDKHDKAKVKLDLLHTDITLPEHGYTKKANEKATLELETEHLASGNTGVPHFRLVGANYVASGKGEIDRKDGGFRTITFDKLTAGKHDLDYLDYEKTDTGIRVKAQGRAFDLSPYMESMSKGGKTQSLQADLTADKLIMGEKRELYNVRALMDCPDLCDSASVSGTVADKTPFTYSIKNGQVNSDCENAGALLQAINVYDGMSGGKMSLKGKYNGSKITGMAVIKDYTIKGAPVLTRMLTIGSLTGVLDTLSGNGIAFDKFYAPFEYERGNIVVKDAKQYGSALGITAKGSISLPEAKYDLSGTLVPSYTLNSLVGKIPLLGNIIVGGEGKGLVALNYSVSGPMAEPSVAVNPLSALTPGFLRGIFDIFDKPAPSLEEMERRQKKAEEKEKKG